MSTPRILLIEDSPSDAALLQHLLASEGVAGECFVHRDRLADGMRYLDRRVTDVVLLDLHLPDSAGIATFADLQRKHPDVPIVVLSGLDDEDRAIRSVQRGAQDYLNKNDLDGRLLLRAIHYAIERKRGEVTLRDGREFAEGLIETAHALVLLLDVTGGILRFNSFAESVTGYTTSEIIGSDWLTALVPKSNQAAMRSLIERAISGRETCVGTHPISAKDGTLHDIRWAGKAIRDRQGQVLFVLFTGHDISDLREAQRRVLQAERLAAIGQMIAGLAHESRNALQRSQSCLDMLRIAVKDRPEALDYVDRIQDAQEHLRQLYEEVRSYSAPIRLQIQEHCLKQVFQDTWDNIASTRSGRDVRLAMREGADPPRCNIDRHRIEQVFRNILENSIAACKDPVEIEVHFDDANHNGKPAVRVTMRDNGPGFSAEQRRRIFEPFFTTKTHGTGLGMAICQRIVEAHGGSLTLGNEGPGAEIVIVLPRAVDSPEQIH